MPEGKGYPGDAHRGKGNQHPKDKRFTPKQKRQNASVKKAVDKSGREGR